MGVGVDPVATGIAMVKGAMEITGIGGDPQAVHPKIEPGVVFRMVVDPTNAPREAGVVHPVVVAAVQGGNVPELLVTGDRVPAAAVQGGVIQEVPVPDPFEEMPNEQIGAGTASDAPMEDIVDPNQLDPNQLDSRPDDAMTTAAPARAVSAIVPTDPWTGIVDTSVSPIGVNPEMNVHQRGLATEHRQAGRSVSIDQPLRNNPRPQLRRLRRMI